MAQHETAGTPGQTGSVASAAPAARGEGGQAADRQSSAARGDDPGRGVPGGKTVRRSPLNGLTLLSLLLCAAAVGLWVRSYFVGYAVEWHRMSSTPDTSTKWVGSVNSGGGAVAVATIARTMQTRGTDGRTRGPMWARVSPRRGFHWNPGRPTRPSAPPQYGGFRTSFFESVSHTNVSSTGAVRSKGSAVTVSWWVPVVLLAAIPVVRGVRFVHGRRRDRRLRMGLCVHCGYDLRGSPGICPECGETSERADPAERLRAPAPG